MKTVLGDHDIIFDPHATDTRQVNARLNREDHARL